MWEILGFLFAAWIALWIGAMVAVSAIKEIRKNKTNTDADLRAQDNNNGGIK